MAFHKFFKALLWDEPISIYGDGKQTRDFNFVSDAVTANLTPAIFPEARGEIFNIGGGSHIALTKVLDMMEQIVVAPSKETILKEPWETHVILLLMSPRQREY